MGALVLLAGVTDWVSALRAQLPFLGLFLQLTAAPRAGDTPRRVVDRLCTGYSSFPVRAEQRQ
jgi:hypothetical protein